MIYIGHPSELSLLFDYFSRSALGADEQDLVLIGNQSRNHFQRLVKGGDGIFEIDDVDLLRAPKMYWSILGFQ
jgi:hypothetical protein